MAKGICGWCGVATHMSPFGPALNWSKGDESEIVQSALQCDACLMLSVATVTAPPRIQHPNDHTTIVRYWSENSPDSLHPLHVDGQQFFDVPGHIAKAASEAHRCRSIGAIMSAVLMARTVVEAIAKEKGVTTGSLFQKIDELGNIGAIKPFTVETAHVIRTFGNDMAHGDISVPLTNEDAEGVLDFMDELLNEVFQNPAKLAALKARAAARK